MQLFEKERNLLKSRIKDLPVMDDSSKSLLAIDLFRFQYKYNEIYRKYATLVNRIPENVMEINDIPFLPISFFKEYKIITGDWDEEIVFESSGTTGQVSSKHFIRDIDWYWELSRIGFRKFYKEEDYCYLALLPSYLEKGQSSLVSMVDHFIQHSSNKSSGFYLYDFEKLKDQLLENERQSIPTILFGVSYALLDFAETYSISLKHAIIIETGGMKGRRKELPKKEIHEILKSNFGLSVVHSEYGMTELLSQAYSKGEGVFEPTSFLDLKIRTLTDPFDYVNNGKTGGINIIDFANIDSCCFIETEDLGKKYDDNSFELMGRMDVADIRGCNLMVDDIM